MFFGRFVELNSKFVLKSERWKHQKNSIRDVAAYLDQCFNEVLINSIFVSVHVIESKGKRTLRRSRTNDPRIYLFFFNYVVVDQLVGELQLQFFFPHLQRFQSTGSQDYWPGLAFHYVLEGQPRYQTSQSESEIIRVCLIFLNIEPEMIYLGFEPELSTRSIDHRKKQLTDFVYEDEKFLKICAKPVRSLFQGLDYEFTVLNNLFERIEQSGSHFLPVKILFFIKLSLSFISYDLPAEHLENSLISSFLIENLGFCFFFLPTLSLVKLIFWREILIRKIDKIFFVILKISEYELDLFFISESDLH